MTVASDRLRRELAVLADAAKYDALLYSGMAGSLGLSSTPTLLISGPGGAGQGFGTTVCGPGDTNGDGYDDIAVSTSTGNVYLFDGSSADFRQARPSC